MTIDHAKLNAAIEELREFIQSRGDVMPADLEDHFCGEPDFLEMVMNPLGRWYASPYAPALAQLVKDGTVTWHRDDKANVHYAIRESKETP